MSSFAASVSDRYKINFFCAQKKGSKKPLRVMRDGLGALYAVHKPSDLPFYFFRSVVAAPIIVFASVCWNTLYAVAELVPFFFEVFEGIYKDRFSPNLGDRLVISLEKQFTASQNEVKKNYKAIKRSASYGFAIFYSSIHAILHRKDPEKLYFDMLYVSELERSWNQGSKRTILQIKSWDLKSIKSALSTFYMFPSFQPIGQFSKENYTIKDGTLCGNYNEFKDVS